MSVAQPRREDEMNETYVETCRGPYKHVRWDTQPQTRDGMMEETWKLGPFSAEHHYVKTDRRYGTWLFGLTLKLRRWNGPWLNVAFGTGAQDWDEE